MAIARPVLLLSAFALLLAAPAATRGDEPAPLASGVRGLVTLAHKPVVIDGKLDEWTRAYCTPVHYSHPSLLDRAARFYYQWDPDALYIGLVALDRKQANPAPIPATFNGDAVEFYLDTRLGEGLRSREWTEGAVHLFYSPFQGAEVKPRWTMRKGIATSETRLEGVEMAATSDGQVYTIEFKLPWANFPDFQPRPGALIALDAELCSGDGGTRTDRTFAYGSPLSVQQPASQAKVQLVQDYDPDYLAEVGPSAFPLWVDTPWVQPERAQVQAVVAIPPEFAEIVGAVEVRLHNADGQVVKTIPAPVEPFGPEGAGFYRAVAHWSIDDFAPNTYFATARVLARTGKPMTRVTPRMVLEAQMSGR